MNVNLYINEIICLFISPQSNLAWIFGATFYVVAECRTSSMFPRFDLYIDLIINVQNSTLHRYVVQYARSMFRAISETTGNSAAIPSDAGFPSVCRE